MFWLILWLVVSIPVALLLGAFISVGTGSRRLRGETSEFDAELHDQTVIG